MRHRVSPLSHAGLLILVVLSTPCAWAGDPFQHALQLRRSQSPPDLVAALQDTAAIVRIVSARRLAVLGPQVGAFEPEMLRAFAHETEPEARYAIAVALGRFAGRSEDVTSAMAHALADSSLLVRVGAAYALSLGGRAGLQTLVDSTGAGSPGAEEACRGALGERLSFDPSDEDRLLLRSIDARAALSRLSPFPPPVSMSKNILAEGEGDRPSAYVDLWLLVDLLQVPTERWRPIAEQHLNDPRLAASLSLHRLFVTRLPETRRLLERAWLETDDTARLVGIQVIQDPAVDRDALRPIVEAAARLTPLVAPRFLPLYGESAVPTLAGYLRAEDSEVTHEVVLALARFPSGRDTLRAWMPAMMAPPIRDHGGRRVLEQVNPEAAHARVAALLGVIEASRIEPNGEPIWRWRFFSPEGSALAELSALGPIASEARPTLEHAIATLRGDVELTEDRADRVQLFLGALACVDPIAATPILEALFQEGGYAANAATQSIPVRRWDDNRPRWEWERLPQLRSGVLNAAHSEAWEVREHAAQLLRQLESDPEALAAVWHVAIRDPGLNWESLLPPHNPINVWRELLPPETVKTSSGQAVEAPTIVAALEEGGGARDRALKIIVMSGLPVAGAVPVLENVLVTERLPADHMAWRALEVLDPQEPYVRDSLAGRPLGESTPDGE